MIANFIIIHFILMSTLLGQNLKNFREIFVERIITIIIL